MSRATAPRNCPLGLAVLLALTTGCSSKEEHDGAVQSAEVGLACAASTDCRSALCIVEARSGSGVAWTGGACSQECSTANTCPTGSACVPFGDGTAWCLGGCRQQSECRAGYVCSSAVSACLPDCRLGFDCGKSLSCDASTGACVPGTRKIGAECALDSDCASGLCTPAQTTAGGTAWSGGYCTELCDAAAPCTAPATCITYADGSSCAAVCTTNTDCRAGYVCSASVGACLPDCRQGFSCGSELTCDAATGACA